MEEFMLLSKKDFLLGTEEKVQKLLDRNNDKCSQRNQQWLQQTTKRRINVFAKIFHVTCHSTKVVLADN